MGGGGEKALYRKNRDSMTIAVEIIARNREKRLSLRALKDTARKILEFLNQNRVEISLALVGNREIQELNAKYRSKDEPTDVLSFPSQARLPTGMQIIGDVVISLEQAKKQAKERKKPLEEEVQSLLIHGILHLLGYDHERSQKDAKIMRGMEKKIYRALCAGSALKV